MLAAILYGKWLPTSKAAGIIGRRPYCLGGLFLADLIKANGVVFRGAFFAEGISGILGVQTPRGRRDPESHHQASITPPGLHFALSN